jgi:hypothetical protein
LSAQKCWNLEYIYDLGGKRGVVALVYVGQKRQVELFADPFKLF